MALLVVPLLAPLALAHSSALDTEAWRGETRFDLSLEGAPLVVPDVPLTMRVHVLPPEGEAPPRAVTARLVPPVGEPGKPFALEALGGGAFESRVILAEPGAWRLALAPEGAAPLEIPFEAHGRAEYFVEVAPETVDRGVLAAGEPERVLLYAHDLQGATPPEGAAVHARATLEKEDGSVEESPRVALVPLGGGRFALDGHWDAPGVLRIRPDAAAWGLEADERPSLDLLVVPAEELAIYAAPEAPHRTPLGGWLPWVAVSLAALLVARRRR